MNNDGEEYDDNYDSMAPKDEKEEEMCKKLLKKSYLRFF